MTYHRMESCGPEWPVFKRLIIPTTGRLAEWVRGEQFGGISIFNDPIPRPSRSTPRNDPTESHMYTKALEEGYSLRQHWDRQNLETI